MIIENYFKKTIKLFFNDYPYAEGWLEQMGYKLDINKTLYHILKSQNQDLCNDYEIALSGRIKQLDEYLISMQDVLKQEETKVKEITLYPGQDKNGIPEEFESISFFPGDIVAVVGPTGSGKSRLLEDIEYGAYKNTPTNRQVLINGYPLHRNRNKKNGHKMVAQLSQNMNFVIDLTVREFLQMHAQCWPLAGKNNNIQKTLEMGNSLSGEGFGGENNVAQLSGGQSRALMIADCALLSPAPIVLIDEIENAGINRRKALKLLADEEKIVFITTHDPLLALLANVRLIIKNGGISKVINRTKKEEETLQVLELLDGKISKLRKKMRSGEYLEGFTI